MKKTRKIGKKATKPTSKKASFKISKTKRLRLEQKAAEYLKGFFPGDVYQHGRHMTAETIAREVVSLIIKELET